MNETRSIPHTDSSSSSLPEPTGASNAKWIGGAVLVGGVAYTLFRYIAAGNHQNQNNSGSSVNLNNNQSARVIERVELNKEVVQSILSQLGLELNGDLEIPKEGRIASNVIVATNKGRYVVRLYPKDCQKDKLETGNVDFEVEALSYLAENNIPVPCPMKFENKGSVIFEINGSKIFVYPEIPGRCIQQNELTAEIARCSASLLSSMIQVSERFIPKAKSAPEGDVGYILKIAQILLQRLPDLKKSQVFQDLIRAVDTSKAEERVKKTPQGIVHGDFFFENIIRGKDDSFSVIDFGDAYYGAVLMDIVTSSMEFSVLPDGSWDLDMFQAALSPHCKWLKKNKIDFSLFYDLLIANCLRFSVYTLPSTLKDNQKVEENPYISRFNGLRKDEFKAQLEEIFCKMVSE